MDSGAEYLVTPNMDLAIVEAAVRPRSDLSRGADSDRVVERVAGCATAVKIRGQKLIQRKGGAAGVAKIPAHFPIDRVLGAPAQSVTVIEIRFKLSVVKMARQR